MTGAKPDLLAIRALTIEAADVMLRLSVAVVDAGACSAATVLELGRACGVVDKAVELIECDLQGPGAP